LDLVIEVIKGSSSSLNCNANQSGESTESAGDLGHAYRRRTGCDFEQKKLTKSMHSTEEKTPLKCGHSKHSGTSKTCKDKPSKKDTSEKSPNEKHDETSSLSKDLEQASLEPVDHSSGSDSSSDNSPMPNRGRLTYHEELYCNALWALVFISKDSSASHPKLFTVVDDLILTLKDTSGHMGCVINAAWALTTICSQRPEVTSAVVLRRDVFLHLAGLLQNRFPRPELEQAEIFKNFAAMLTPVVAQVEPAALWEPLLLAAATAAEIPDEAMHESLRKLLNDVKSSVGEKEWGSLFGEMDASAAAILRQKYNIS